MGVEAVEFAVDLFLHPSFVLLAPCRPRGLSEDTVNDVSGGCSVSWGSRGVFMVMGCCLSQRSGAGGGVGSSVV